MGFSKHKSGTSLFNTAAGVHCVTEGSRACPGVLMRTRDMFPIDAVTALPDMCEASGVKVRTLLPDREFYATNVMNLLDARSIAPG